MGLAFGAASYRACGLVLSDQPTRTPQPNAGDGAQSKLRDRLIELRVEIELLRFDYELARDDSLENLKIQKGFNMMGCVMEAFARGPQESKEDREKNRTDEEKEADAKANSENEERQKEAEKFTEERNSYILQIKKELGRRFTLLSEKRLELEDAERTYDKSFR